MIEFFKALICTSIALVIFILIISFFIKTISKIEIVQIEKELREIYEELGIIKKEENNGK